MDWNATLDLSSSIHENGTKGESILPCLIIISKARRNSPLNIKKLSVLGKRLGVDSPMANNLEKTICQLLKVLLSLLEIHPLSFVPFVHSSLSFTVSMLFSSEGEGIIFTQFVIQCMNLTRCVLLCTEYQINKSAFPQANQVNAVKEEFFKPDVLNQICNSLISCYLPLTQEELAEWDFDPEAFECEEIGDSCKYRLRYSTESFFLALFRSFRSVLTPLLVQLVFSNHQPVSPHDLAAVLRKDAVYLAVGLAAFDLYDEIDMDKWFNGLQAELGIKEGHYRIIRRRAAWLLGEWSGVKLNNQLRPQLYRSFLALLDGGEDLAVRLTAANALRRTIDDFEFDPTQFMGLLESFVGLLFNLLLETKECETKMHVLTVFSYIVERLGEAIKPYSSSLMQYLPVLWTESVNHNVLRGAIVSTLVHCVRALVTDEISSFMYPVLEVCLDMSQEPSMYLLEDGLELWHAILEYSAALSPSMLQLLKYMPNILETSSEHLQPCCLILQAYVVLSPSLFFSEYGNKLFSCCFDLLNDIKPEGIAMVYNFVEMCMRVDIVTTLQKASPLLLEVFLRVHENREYPMVLSAILPIMSRVLLHSLDFFCHIVEKVSQNKNETAETALRKILSTWTEKMSLVNSSIKQKLLALALTSLISVDSSVVMNLIPAILRNIIEVLNDIMDLGENGQQVDTLLLSEMDPDYVSETEHEMRLLKLNENDPVYKIVLKDYFKSQMGELSKRIGDQSMDGIIKLLDAETIEGLKLYSLN